jgi:chemotaxis signal transduction protein
MTSASAQALLVARIGTERYAFDIGAVREVVAIEDVAEVPARLVALRGVMPRRDGRVSLLSLAALLGGGDPPHELGGAAVVVTLGGVELALEVDEVEAVVDGGAPIVAGAVAGGLPARGVWRWGQTLVTVLDMGLLAERVTSLEERKQ